MGAMSAQCTRRAVITHDKRSQFLAERKCKKWDEQDVPGCWWPGWVLLWYRARNIDPINKQQQLVVLQDMSHPKLLKEYHMVKK